MREREGQSLMLHIAHAPGARIGLCAQGGFSVLEVGALGV